MISVIIPTFNRAQMIERSAKSVLNQTYRDLELIIVDDCSSDNTKEIVAELMASDERVRYIRHQENAGACAARNTGIDAAMGCFIAFQDSDDEWRSDKLMIQMEFMKNYHADVCFCKMQRYNYPARNSPIYPENMREGIIDYEDLITGSYASTQTILAEANICKKHHFDTSLKKLQDFDWNICACKEHQTVFVDKILVDVYLQPDSISLKSSMKNVEAYETLYFKHKELCEKIPELHVCFLDAISRFKVISGDHEGKELRKIYSINRDKKILIKYILCRIGILSRYYNRKPKNVKDV